MHKKHHLMDRRCHESIGRTKDSLQTKHSQHNLKSELRTNLHKTYEEITDGLGKCKIYR